MLALTPFAAAGSLSGSVQFSGTAPESQVINMAADPTCASANTGPVVTEKVVLNDNGTLKNAFVYIKEGVKGEFEVPGEPVTLDQKGCRYEPHVFGLQVGQKLEIINSDSTLHNVHGLPKESKEFNLGMPIKGMKLKRTFGAPEVMVKFKCDVHPWMNAYGGVLTHPYFGVSNDAGKFEILDVPAGDYVVEIWHEAYGVQSQNVTVGDDPTALDFTFSG